MKLRIPVGSNGVVLTTGWGKAVKAYNIEKDDIVMFKFGKDEKGALDLTVVPIHADK